MNDINVIYIAVMVLCIVMSAFFSASETAFSSANKTRLKTLVEKGNHRAAVTMGLAESYDKLISTILIGNNVVNILASSLGTIIFVGLYGDIGATISTAVLTVVVLLFGEISPKSIAKETPEKFAMFAAPILKGLIWLLTPVNAFFSAWKRMLAKLLKVEADNKMSQEELLMFVEEVQQEGSIDSEAGQLLRNAIEFTDREATDILTHRVDLVAVPVTATKEETAHVFAESMYSRLLVYEGTIDHVVGVIHQKDFYTGAGISEKPVAEIMTPAVFVPKGERISQLLKLLQKTKSHVAVVVDEYGGTFGIVTMEDILEELVGEIWDEHDEIVESIRQIDEDTYEVDGIADLEDFSDYFRVKTDSTMVSVGGWMMELLSKLPEVGDVVEYGGWTVEVVSVENHRVTKLKVTQ
ncbi:MAG: HlyC/CorC family transporter [Oscillospiraceae bacterium]|nr:HlyC/CorC family transporter [Oscillospiraceae bacterium]